MEGTIAHYRRGRHTQTNNQFIIYLDETKEESKKLIGKKVTWKSQKGKEITGKVTNLHGNNGAVRVLFERALPGQSLGTKVEIK